MNLKNTKILITAGPTWVKLDKVRVISNIASAKTGIILANKFVKAGARVTLFLGPVGEVGLGARIKVRRYRFFEELAAILKRELLSKRYDIVIHSAAVSDYKPKKILATKLKSGVKNLKLNLGPTPKLVNRIKNYADKVLLVMFKLELGVSKKILLERARKAMRSAGADLCVANTFSKNGYKAFIVGKDRVFCVANSKEKLAKKLLDVIRSEE